MRHYEAYRPTMIRMIQDPDYSYGEAAVVYCSDFTDLFTDVTVEAQSRRCKLAGRKYHLTIQEVFIADSPRTFDCPVWGDMANYCWDNQVHNAIIDSPHVIATEYDEVLTVMSSLLICGGVRVHFACDEWTTERMQKEALNEMEAKMEAYDHIIADLNSEPGTSGYWRSLKASLDPTNTPEPVCTECLRKDVTPREKASRDSDVPVFTNFCVGCKLPSYRTERNGGER